jgi:uncharacterized membrane protein YciS (DUF1049 family)
MTMEKFFENMPPTKLLMLFVFVIVVLLIARAIFKRNSDKDSHIDLDDLLIDPATNKISKAAAVLIGSWAIASWVILYQVLTEHLTDTNFAAYMAVFAAPAITKLIVDAKNADKP